MNDQDVHPLGEAQDGSCVPDSGPIPVNTFGGRVHVEWDPNAAVTPFGQLPFFIEFLKISDLFDPWVEACPLEFSSPNARLLSEPWILDADVTIKPLYGHQEGAVLGCNPHKPGRPSHTYHPKNGSEMCSAEFQHWGAQRGIRLLFIQPVKPTQNAHIERFNRTVRHEWLGEQLFESIRHAQRTASEWLWR